MKYPCGGGKDCPGGVAPYAGAGIEILSALVSVISACVSPPTRGRELKWYSGRHILPHRLRRPLRGGRELKYLRTNVLSQDGQGVAPYAGAGIEI